MSARDRRAARSRAARLRLSGLFWRAPLGEGAAAARSAAARVRARLPRVARRALRLVVLDGQSVHDRDRAHLERRQLPHVFESSAYRTIALRTIGIAAAVTLTDAVLAFPLALLHGARRVEPRSRAFLFVARPAAALVELPRPRLHLAADPRTTTGVLNWTLQQGRACRQPHRATRTGRSGSIFTYVWLPFMILPVYGALERIPRVAHRGVARSRRRRLRRRSGACAAARAARRRRRLDLHVLADARRLRHAAARGRLGVAVHRQRRLRVRRHLEQRAVRRGVRGDAARRHGRLSR